MRYWYVKDGGATVLYGEKEDVALHHPTAERIADRPSPDYEYKEGKWILREGLYREKRVAEYPPIGNQLDEILKYLDTKTDLPEGLKKIISDWKLVKERYPKQ